VSLWTPLVSRDRIDGFWPRHLAIKWNRDLTCTNGSYDQQSRLLGWGDWHHFDRLEVWRFVAQKFQRCELNAQWMWSGPLTEGREEGNWETVSAKGKR